MESAGQQKECPLLKRGGAENYQAFRHQKLRCRLYRYHCGSEATAVLVIKMLETGKVYLTQKQLADRYNVSVSTIKNWRDRGYLPYLQLPDSTRVLYPLDGILEAELQFTTPAKEVKQKKESAERKRKKPVISATPKKEWRI